MRRPRGAVDGIVRIANAEGRHVGMGILIEGDRVLTCAHVVNLAIGRTKIEASPPPENASVSVSFPFAGSATQKGRVIAWSPPDLGNPDAALIALNRPAPDYAGIATLADIPDATRLPGELTVFGMTGDQVLGGHVEVELLGPVSGGWWQLVGTREIGTYVVRGFSGGAVWSTAERAVVGMLVAVARVPDAPVEPAEPAGGRVAAGLAGAVTPADDTTLLPPPAERRTAYAQPVEAIRAAIPDLPVEHRTGSAASQRLMAAAAVVLFLVALVHLLAIHSAGMRALVPYAQDSSLIATVFAVPIIGALSTLAFWMIWRHVLCFSRSRPWETRFPSILGRYPSDSLLNTRLGSVIGLLLLVGFPLWAQIDAMNQFLNGRPVVMVAGPNEEFHAHPEAGLMTLWSFGHSYRIASEDDPKNSVSFYPIVQPILTIFYPAFAAGLALLIFVELFIYPRRRKVP